MDQIPAMFVVTGRQLVIFQRSEFKRAHSAVVMLYTVPMVKRYFQWLLLLVLSQSVVAGDPSAMSAFDLSSQEAVRRQLEGMEWRSNQYDWKTKRAAVEGPLAAIARSEAQPHFIRGRALEVLTLMPGPLALEVFEALIQQDQSPVLRRRAVDCLCAMPLATTELDYLLPLLESPDRHLGVRVAGCLAKITAPSLEIRTSMQRYRASAQQWEIQSADIMRESE